MEPIEEQHQEEEEEEEEEESQAFLMPSFPTGRVKKIMKLDKDINKVNSEALHLVSLSVQLFLGSLVERARDAVVAKKRRMIKLEHLRSAVRCHPPTSDFLLDCLPKPKPSSAGGPKPAPRDKQQLMPAPAGARRIDEFFSKPSADVQ